MAVFNSYVTNYQREAGTARNLNLQLVLKHCFMMKSNCLRCFLGKLEAPAVLRWFLGSRDLVKGQRWVIILNGSIPLSIILVINLNAFHMYDHLGFPL